MIADILILYLQKNWVLV